MSRSPEQEAAFRAWVERAKRVDIAGVLQKLGHRPDRDDKGGPCPCPSCVSHNKVSDRFSINRRKNVFYCRASGSGGGPISLVMHVQGCAFVEAVEFVTGEDAPKDVQRETETERAARHARIARETREAEERAAATAEEEGQYRAAERERAFALWNRAVSVPGTLTQDYLARRGLYLPANANIKHLDRADLWDMPKPHGGKIVHSGPAMCAAITAGDGAFMGVHLTWIDLAQAKGKALVPDPKSGELLPAKKVRGSMKGGAIFLGGASRGTARRVFMGEGNESTLSAYCDLADSAKAGDTRAAELLAASRFMAGVSLGNIGGKASRSIAHPELRYTDRRGRVKAVRVRGPEPVHPDPDPVISLPPGCAELYLLEDGDSETVFTRNALLRGAARFTRENPDLVAMLVRAPEGLDRNDVRMARLAAAQVAA